MESVYKEEVPFLTHLDTDLADLINYIDLAELEIKVERLHGRVYEMRPLFGHLDTHFVIIGSDSSTDVIASHQGLFEDGSETAPLNLSGMLLRACRRISCVHRVIGLLGFDAGNGRFVPRLYVMVDRHGTVYGYERCFDRVCRLAESLDMFFRIGGLKSVYNFKFDRQSAGIGKLEKPPVCPHSTEKLRRVGRLGIPFSLSQFTGFGDVIGFASPAPVPIRLRRTSELDDGRTVPERSEEMAALDSYRYFDALRVIWGLRSNDSWVNVIWTDELRAFANENILRVFGKGATGVSDKIYSIIHQDDELPTPCERDEDDDIPNNWIEFMFWDSCARCLHRHRVRLFRQRRRTNNPFPAPR